MGLVPIAIGSGSSAAVKSRSLGCKVQYKEWY